VSWGDEGANHLVIDKVRRDMEDVGSVTLVSPLVPSQYCLARFFDIERWALLSLTVTRLSLVLKGKNGIEKILER
jgi:hypothetical protein